MPKVFVDALFGDVGRLLLIQRNEYETDVFNKCLFRLKSAYLNGGTLAKSRQGSGRSCDKRTRRSFPLISFPRSQSKCWFDTKSPPFMCSPFNIDLEIMPWCILPNVNFRIPPLLPSKFPRIQQMLAFFPLPPSACESSPLPITSPSSVTYQRFSLSLPQLNFTRRKTGASQSQNW